MAKCSNAYIVLCILILNSLHGVRSWKNCADTFCGKVRKSPEGFPSYTLDLSTVTVQDGSLTGNLTDPDGLHKLMLHYEYDMSSAITLLQIVDPELPFGQQITKMLKLNARGSLVLDQITEESVTVTNGNRKSIFYSKLFKIESYINDELVSVINRNNRLVVYNNEKESAVAIDVTFAQAQQAYGIPLHADNLALRTTTSGDTDPYRLFNRDGGHYNVKSTKSLHTSIPILCALGKNQSAAIYFLSYSQMWIDITHGDNQIDTFFMNEVPYLPIILFNGPTLADVIKLISNFKPYSNFIPPYTMLGYHQSRISYSNEKEVLDVIQQFSKNNLPLESIGLDPTYTDDGKYFTWDRIRFPDPQRLQAQVGAQNRSLILTIGPHFKVEKGYFVHDEASSKRYYVRNHDGSDYVGKGLPGNSSYFDFMNPKALTYYMNLINSQFKSENFHLYLDLNEPTVLENEEHENTLPSDLLHELDEESIPHVYLHNAYSFSQVFGTYWGLISQRSTRLFLITRSLPALDDLTGCTHTGDNYASWEHLQISFPMCLSVSLVSKYLCGANVGGFAGVPDEELYQRWYQAGAWLPFYRAHFDSNVPRREPYLFSDKVKSRVRNAIQQRYAHLPVWYTLVFENLYSRHLIIRPLFYHYPQEEATYTIDHELLVGRDILAAPIMKPGAFIVTVYLPGGDSEIWYNTADNYKALRGIGQQVLYVNLDYVPVFYRGGSIIVRKDTPRLTTAATVNDPYTLYICLDINNTANGTLYVDDYKSFAHTTRAEALYVGFSFSENSLHAFKIIEYADYDGAAPIGEIVILNPPKNIAGTRLNVRGKSSYDVGVISYSDDGNILRLTNLALNFQKPFKLTLI